MTVVDYSAINSGLGGPPYPVSVVGVDRLANWIGTLTRPSPRRQARAMAASHHCRDRSRISRFRSHVVASVFNTALSMHNYLNTPGGAIYGFAPAAAVPPDLARHPPLAEDAHSRTLSGLVVRGQRGLHGRHPCRQRRSRDDPLTLGWLRRYRTSLKIAAMKKIFTAMPRHRDQHLRLHPHRPPALRGDLPLPQRQLRQERARCSARRSRCGAAAPRPRAGRWSRACAPSPCRPARR